MEIMVDIETLGTGHNAALMQIGAVCFNFEDGVQEAHELMQLSSKAPGDRCFNVAVANYPEGERDAGALTFWAAPEQALALSEIRRLPALPVVEALQRFAAFVGARLSKRGCIWAKPPQFDLRILHENFRMFGVEIPWHFRQESDLRTLIRLAKRVPAKYFTVPDLSESRLIPHYALHDAAEQAVLAQAAFHALVSFDRGRNATPRGTL